MFFNLKVGKLNICYGLPKPPTIFLIRHGESEANVNPVRSLELSNHIVQLTEKGHVQAQNAGKALCHYFEKEVASKKIYLYHSEYKRAA